MAPEHARVAASTTPKFELSRLLRLAQPAVAGGCSEGLGCILDAERSDYSAISLTCISGSTFVKLGMSFRNLARCGRNA